ncbi:MAG TPA: GAF domain-containing sensor histidine kinase [Candidatus Binatia bacterium]|nr:GAF domain-containing sensor histidine kinase [Candidatus Binatia bacterium]
MSSISSFFEQNIVIVYFLYGLAFFSMGLAVWLESGRTSELRLARAMGPLAAFGFLHGLHEWAEMFGRLGAVVPTAPAIAQSVAFSAARLGVLFLSFLMLIIFGVRLIHFSGKGRGNEQTFVWLTAGTLIVIWVVSVFATQSYYRFCLADCLSAIDVLTRYILAIPGALLAAWAMVLEQRAFRERGMAAFGRDLQWAAVALLLYGAVGQFFTEPSVLFPSNVINSDLFFSAFGVPVQFFRACMAALLAIFIIRALRAFELEHEQHLAAARQARLEAQHEALQTQQQARQETEALNQELKTAVQDLSLLYDLSRKLASTLQLDVMLAESFEIVLRSIPRVQAGMVLLREKADEPLELKACSGCDCATSNGSSGLFCAELEEVGGWVAAWGMAALRMNGEIRPLQECAQADSAPETEGKACVMGIPLMIDNQVRGSLVLGMKEAPALTQRDLSLLTTIAGQLSIAMENATLYEQLQAREALRGELYHQIVSAQEGERQRIARELHDGTGQVLTGLGLGLMAAAETVKSNPELASRQLIELKDLNARALRELRDLIADLRPSVLDDLGLVAALHGQAQEFEERTGVAASLMVGGRRRRLQAEMEIVLFRIAQEALTNVAKHAAASKVLMRLEFEEERVQLVITDNGRGFDPREALQMAGTQRRAWGLLGMQERVTLVGGVCEIASRPGQGSTVRIVIPLDSEERGND